MRVILVVALIGVLMSGVVQAEQSSANGADAVLQRLAGNWDLVKFVNVDGSGVEHDAGFEGGRIMYDRAGHMAAQLMRRNRENYIAYYGRVTVDSAAAKVTHHVEGSSLANWVGTDLVRYYEISADGNELRLSLRNAQGRVTGTLTWRRLPQSTP